ncbi:hypothetical protein BGZ65_011288, partial [Modicella reniformis]
ALSHAFRNLTHLDIDSRIHAEDIPNLTHVLSKAPNLIFLKLNTPLDQLPEVYTVITERQKYPLVITFKNSAMCTSAPSGDSPQSKGALQDLKDLSNNCETPQLDNNWTEYDQVVDDFAATTREGSALKPVGRKLANFGLIWKMSVRLF